MDLLALARDRATPLEQLLRVPLGDQVPRRGCVRYLLSTSGYVNMNSSVPVFVYIIYEK